MLLGPEPVDSKPVALLDLDGTLADYDLAMAKALTDLQSPNDPPLEVSLMEGPHWLQERKRLIKRGPGFWRNLPPILRSFQVVDAMREIGYRFAVLTKASRKVPAAWAEKALWCDEHLHDAEVIVAEGKSLVYGRVLFDDWPPYVESWIEWRPRGLVIMLDQPHNRAFTHPRVLRYYGDGTLEPVEAERERLLRRLREALLTAAR